MEVRCLKSVRKGFRDYPQIRGPAAGADQRDLFCPKCNTTDARKRAPAHEERLWRTNALRDYFRIVMSHYRRALGCSAAFPPTRLLGRSDSPDSPHLQVRDDINTSAFCRTCIGDRNLSEVRTGIWPDGRCLHCCAASKIANAALCGSAITAKRPISSIFMGGM